MKLEKNVYDDFVKVAKEYATLNGWWHIQANSSNKFDFSNTYLWNGMEWQDYTTLDSNPIIIDIGESLQINSTLSAGISQIPNILSTPSRCPSSIILFPPPPPSSAG